MSLQTTDHVQRSFSRSFASYHDEACQQAKIAGHLVQDLIACGAPKALGAVAEFGCGTGHLTRRLRGAFDIQSLTLNDLSPEAARTAQSAGADFLCGDALQVAWPAGAQLVASASMIQWLPDPTAFVRKAALELAPGGWLAVSGFGPAQYEQLTRLGFPVRAPGLCGAEHLAQAAADSGLQVMKTGGFRHALHLPTPRDVLTHLRKTGVNGRAQKAWTKTALARFTANYWHLSDSSASVPLTYHATWIIAHKPAA